MRTIIHIYDELNDSTWCGIPDKDMGHHERTIDPEMGDTFPSCDVCIKAEGWANYPEIYWKCSRGQDEGDE